jgi:hypothetical protein
MKKLKEELKGIKDQMIHNVIAYNKHRTVEGLKIKTTKYLLAHTHPIDRENYAEKLRRIKKKMEEINAKER